MTDADRFEIVGLDYVSMYVQDYEAALAWYTRLFGEPVGTMDRIRGWKLGSTYLTLLDASRGTHPGSNPRNAEYGIRVASPGAVDRLYDALLDAGATSCMAPEDGEMYEPMRFAAVDDPFGMRIDVFCPIGSAVT